MTSPCLNCGGNGQVLVDVIPAGAQGNLGDVPLYGPCPSCQAITIRNLAAERIAQQEASARHEAERRAALIQAREEIQTLARKLRSIGSPGIRARQVKSGEKKVLFKGYVPTYKKLRSAWPLRSFLWNVIEGSKDGEFQHTTEVETEVTEVGEVVPMSPRSSYGMMGGYTKYVKPVDLVPISHSFAKLADRYLSHGHSNP